MAKELHKEEIASQWAGLSPEKLLQESFLKQLDALQALDQLAPLTAMKEHLPGDIIDICHILEKQIITLSINSTALWRIAQTDTIQTLYRCSCIS